MHLFLLANESFQWQETDFSVRRVGVKVVRLSDLGVFCFFMFFVCFFSFVLYPPPSFSRNKLEHFQHARGHVSFLSVLVLKVQFKTLFFLSSSCLNLYLKWNFN